MAEPENHTLRLLREFREEFRQYRSDFAAFRASMEASSSKNDERFEELTKLIAGEMVVGRYAAAGVEKRLDVLEGRVTALEETR
jgi:hypothetical protein